MELRYRVQDLGPHFYPLSFGTDGRIFGIRTEGEEPQLRQYLAAYDHGGLFDLWPIPPRLWTLAANSHGWLTGFFGDPQHAFLFADGTFTDLGTLYGHRSCGVAINDQGWIAGWTTAPGGGEETWQQNPRATLIADGRMIDLDPECDHSKAQDINDVGEIVGEGIGGTGFLYRGGSISHFSDFHPRAINVKGDIAGHVKWRPAIVRNYRLPPLDLGLPLERAGRTSRINARGTIVGTDFLHPTTQAGQNDRSFFVYREWACASLSSLFPPESGWQPLFVPELAEDDRIAGVGSIHGEQHAYLLTPEVEVDWPDEEVE